MLTGHPIQFDLQTDNYIGTHNFQVNIEGIDVINTEFVFVGGVRTKTAEQETKKGTFLKTVYAPIEFQRIYKGVDDLYAWRLEVENGNVERRDVTVTMMDSASRPIRTVVLERAWPISWEMPHMDASSTGPAFESFYLKAERVREVAP
jgi:phage tail-like protein